MSTDSISESAAGAVASVRETATGAASSAAAVAGDRPEIPVAAAFGGGLVLALLLKRLAR